MKNNPPFPVPGTARSSGTQVRILQAVSYGDRVRPTLCGFESDRRYLQRSLPDSLQRLIPIEG